jgi:predicted transcriptional regulator
MQLDGDVDLEAGRAAATAPSPRKHMSSVTRKVTIRLSENIHSQLEAATERPGVGKSMVVEAALAQFMNPARPQVENPAQKSIEAIHARFDSLERDLRTIAETVALHARYHLAVMPPLPQQQQREASQLGDERFKVLAEQVDRRVREGRPLLHETIDRLKATPNQPESISGRQGQRGSEPAQIRRDISTNANIDHEIPAAAGEGGSNPNFRHLPNSFC